MKQESMIEMLERFGVQPEYVGKSKTVYGLPNGNVLLAFTDGFTGANGIEDPGANHNIGTKEGLGHKNLAISSFLYESIARDLGIPTQNVAVDLENNTLEAIRAEQLGSGFHFEQDGQTHQSHGLEFIARNKAWGSFLKRYPEAEQGQPMIDEDGIPFVEVSVKNDDAGDPFFTGEEYKENFGVDGYQYNMGVQYTGLITKYLTELFAQKGLELIDIKMEFGTNKHGDVMLTDEISAGSLRALNMETGKVATKDEIYQILMQPEQTKDYSSIAIHTPHSPDSILNNGILTDELFSLIEKQVAKYPNAHGGVFMGSTSDWGVMEKASQMLDRFNVEHIADVASIHRHPKISEAYSLYAEQENWDFIIAGAGAAAHLPGAFAAHTSTVPVYGVPVNSQTTSSNQLTPLLSIVEMPPNKPVATVGTNRADNAALQAMRAMARNNPELRRQLTEFDQELINNVEAQREEMLLKR